MSLLAAARPPTRPRPPAHRHSSRQHDHDRSTPDRAPLAEIQASNHAGSPSRTPLKAKVDSSSPGRDMSGDVSVDSTDRAWLGSLERDELEKLLIEAGRKIKEREQKLMIAANIGKALLDKNLTLRSGIMNSMASSTSFCNLNDIEDMINQYSTADPLDSPSRQSTAASIQPHSPDSDVTPLASQDSAPNGHGYFDHHRSTSNSSNHSASANPWIPSDSGLIPSQPCSPSASIASLASRRSRLSITQHSASSSPVNKRRPRPSLLQLQTIENQRQLALLGNQNDILHQQISELQHEAEDAKREGSKRLTKLSKEIRGLKAELEAATLRNTELENFSTGSRPSSTPRPGPVVFAVRPAASPLRFPTPSSPAQPLAFGLPEAEFGAELDHPLPTSTSNLETLASNHSTSAGESALVAQLLAKIKELEETNAAMAKAEEEFGSRMGRAMEEDERLRDAHSAFEHSIVDLYMSSMTDDEGSEYSQMLTSDTILARSTPSKTEQILSQLARGSPTSSAGSPGRTRRAPGNRHVIQNSKIIRSAIRKTENELAFDVIAPTSVPLDSALSRSSTESSLGSYSIDLSADSSTASSPRRKSLAHKASCSSIGPGGRPRIRITPSMEDLGRRSKSHERAAEQSDKMPAQESPQPAASKYGSLRPSDALLSSSKRPKQMTRAKSTGTNVPEGSPSKVRGQVNYRFTIESPASRSGDQSQPTSPMQRSVTTYQVLCKRWSFSSSVSLATDFQRDAPESSPATRLWNPAQTAFTPKSIKKSGRTLGSELGSIFGGDDRKHDFDDDLPQQRRSASPPSFVSDALTIWRPEDGLALSPYRPKAEPEKTVTDRPTANYGRLVAANAEEHEDDLDCVLQSAPGKVEDIELSGSPLRPRDAALVARMQAEKQGEWTTGTPVIETGGLKDYDEPRGTQFELIAAVNDHQAVAWADDDDYGMSISEREAVELGLLEATAATRSKYARVYRTLTRGSEPRYILTRPWGGRGAKPATEAESKELEAERRLETLLRRRRTEVLRERGYDPYWQEQENALVNTYAYSPQRLQDRSRRAWATRESGFHSSTPRKDVEGAREDYWPETCDSPARPGTHRSTEDWVKGVAGNTGALIPLSDVDPDASGVGDFEILDCPTWKKQGGRGTDYFPTSIRARYHPRMLKQRVTVLTQSTYGWIEDWVQFALVVFLAFLVTLEQGPTRYAQRVQMPRTPMAPPRRRG